jgi:protein-S-isoprenylcysteine O-methyltransferase Ste14
MIYCSDMRLLRRSPVQTFILVPLAVLLWELALGALHFQPAGLLLMLWGYAQYRLVGRYRVRLGGGGPGLSGAPAERVVETGVYRWMRNPMYLGHIVYMIGVAVLFQSWLAALIAAARAVWFHFRVLRDERGLAERFGEPYVVYCKRVKRWLPGLF